MARNRIAKRPLAEVDINVRTATSRAKAAKKSLDCQASSTNSPKGDMPDDWTTQSDTTQSRGKTREIQAQEQLENELGQSVAPDDPRVAKRTCAMAFDEWAKEGGYIWKDTGKSILVEAAKLRGLPCNGTRKDLIDVLTKDDEHHHIQDPSFVQMIINTTLTNSPACRRALEVVTKTKVAKALERVETCHDESKCIDEAHDLVRFFAEDAAHYIVSKGEEPTVDLVGARCFHQVVYDWVGMGHVGGYSSFRVAELRELLRLRGERSDGRRIELVIRIEWSDYVNYGGPFPTSEEAPPDYEPPKWNVKQLWNFSDLVETHRDKLSSGKVPHGLAQDPIAQELLKLAEAKGTIDLKKLTSENDSD